MMHQRQFGVQRLREMLCKEWENTCSLLFLKGMAGVFPLSGLLNLNIYHSPSQKITHQDGLANTNRSEISTSLPSALPNVCPLSISNPLPCSCVYRSSSLSLGNATGGLQPGNRMPGIKLDDGSRLFEHMRGPHATEIVTTEGQHILIRPDGYIAQISEKHFSEYGGQPTHAIEGAVHLKEQVLEVSNLSG